MSRIRQLFHDFAEFYGETKFTNVTNGITPRRWLHVANPQLSALITKTLGSDDWLTSLDELAHLRDYANDKEFQKAFMAVKRQRKVLLAEYIEKSCGIKVSPDALFDVQVKRIHEYKRQFMNILGCALWLVVYHDGRDALTPLCRSPVWSTATSPSRT